MSLLNMSSLKHVFKVTEMHVNGHKSNCIYSSNEYIIIFDRNI